MKLLELSNRVLEKLGVLSPGETASSEDTEKAKTALRAAHQSVVVARLARWTSNSLPSACEEPYVTLAAALVASDFNRAADPSWWKWGMNQIAAAAATPVSQGPVCAEYF
ncbi:hypothetical protein N5K27_22450 [Pigmentiphaga sp. GD03639]|uniref:hypothetical protein n=1 Tax=Pigmentiphaga sp. GD03639 TaxID=2975354 RepID=UPI00244A45EA|nr:hypothetical protein [Pigmentiphaga sp. GD03639]MDH2239073.1 hypothetical protein [Pigmentiphaga sp. GD03639]